MTSTTDAIIDDQVNADAFLIPSTTEQLEANLGERIPTPVTLWNTNALNPPSPSPASQQPQQPVGPNPVSNLGQSLGSGAGPESTAQASVGLDFSEPAPAPAPYQGQGPQGGPAPQPGNAPEPPGAASQPAAPVNEQTSPENRPIPQPAPNDKQGSPQGNERAQAPGGETAAALTTKPSHLAPPIPDSNQSTADRQPGQNDASQTLSVVFGTALVVSGGHHFGLRQKDRSQARAIPRWFGAERPVKRKK